MSATLRSLEASVSAGLRLMRSRAVRWIFGLGAAAIATWALVSEHTAVAAAFGELDARSLLVAGLATAANLALTGLLWRGVLADLGSRLPLAPAARIFFVGQVGKYLPGSIWPALMQAELGSDHGVPRRRTATAMVVSLLVATTVGLAVVLATLPLIASDLPAGIGWVAVLLFPLAVVIHPRVLGRGVDVVLRAAGREPLEQHTSVTGTLVAAGYALASWICAGLQVLALAAPLGLTVDLRTAARLVGGYAIAWAVGFLVVAAPAGAGAREVALAAVLTSGGLGRGSALVVVLLSRVLFTVADLAAAGLAILAARHTTHRATGA